MYHAARDMSQNTCSVARPKLLLLLVSGFRNRCFLRIIWNLDNILYIISNARVRGLSYTTKLKRGGSPLKISDTWFPDCGWPKGFHPVDQLFGRVWKPQTIWDTPKNDWLLAGKWAWPPRASLIMFMRHCNLIIVRNDRYADNLTLSMDTKNCPYTKCSLLLSYCFIF